jgi:CMD domain protein
MTDIIATAAGVTDEPSITAARAFRSAATAGAQESYSALFDDHDDTGLSAAERLAVALRVAVLEGDESLTDHYHSRLSGLVGPADERAIIEADGAPALSSPRLTALLGYVDVLTASPVEASVGHLQALEDAGLTPAEIVTASQAASFVAFQVRLVAGIAALAAALEKE